MNREQRRKMQRKMTKIGLFNFPVQTEHREWCNVPDNKSIPNNKFKKLLKNYRGDLHKDLIRNEQKMKNANLCYNEVWGTKDNFMVLNFFLEMQKFRNRLTFPQVIEILELFLSKLNPISQKVLYMKISVLFDFVDTDNQRLLDKVRVAIVDVQDYTDDEFYERVEFYKSLFKMAEETLPSNQNSPNGWLDRMKNLTECVAELRNKTFLESAFEDEDFEKFYDDED